MARLPKIFVFAVLVAAASACSSEKAPAEKPAASPGPTESAQDLHLSNLKDQFERIESYAKRQPRQLNKILTQIENFKTEVAGTDFAKRADNLAAKARERFKLDAEATYRKLCEEANKAIMDGNVSEAVAVYGEYPTEFRSTEWQKKIDEAIEPLKAEAEANRRMETLREQVKEQLADNNPEAALALVNRYPKYMRTASKKAGHKWQELHSDLSAKVKAIEKQRRKEDTLPWEDLFTGADMNEWTLQSGNWELKEGCIVCKYDGEQHAFISCESPESPWDNFILELEFKIVSGDFLVLGVRGKNISGRSEFDQISLTPDKFPQGKFHDLIIEARGDTYTLREKASNTLFTQAADTNYDKGFLGFFILPGAEVHIRKVRIKRLK
jgi:hypothetical protein